MILSLKGRYICIQDYLVGESTYLEVEIKQ
jgi:hypothetical protein